MIRERPARRFSVMMVLAISATLALGSFWVLEVMRRSSEDPTTQGTRSEPDYFVEKFNFVRMSKSGEAQYNISGDKLTHNPVDNTHAIDLPVVHSLSNTRPPMTTRAVRALADQNNGKLHMYENVQIDRPASARTESFQLKSEYLLILTEDDVMQTDKPVEITLGKSKLTGTGMVANNATRELRLSSNVHATYQPPAQPLSP
jgi:lipopolysaccharide export system protein LptC